jgi:PAS domain S-box-containing protein
MAEYAESDNLPSLKKNTRSGSGPRSRKAATEINEGRRFSSTILNNSPNPIMVINPDNSIRYINPAFMELTGFSKSEIVGSAPPFAWWPKERIEEYLADYQNEKIKKREYLFRKKNGETFWTEVNARIVKDAGKTDYHLVYWTDITGPKLAADALRESETFNSALLANAPNPILVTAPDTSVIYINPALENLTGFSSAEVIGRKLPYPWFPPDQIGQYRLETASANREIINRRERRYLKKNGEIIWIALSIKAIKDQDKTKCYISNWTDITEQKAAENALRESEAFNASLLDNAPNPVLVTNLDGSVRYVNPAVERLTGYSANELVGTKAPYPWWPEQKMSQYLNQNSSGRTIELDIQERNCLKKNGEEFWIALSVRHIKENGETRYYLANWLDITERKKMEERIIDLYEKEKQQRQELQDEAKARGMFIDVLAHELRTPLTPILASADALIYSLSSQPDTIQNKLARNIHGSSRTLACRLEELLDIARYSRGVFKLKVEPTDIPQYIEDVVSRFKPTTDQKSQKLVVAMPESLPVIEIDRSRLEQVLFNLLSNSSKFSPQNATITLSVQIIGNELRVNVKDEGIGIPAQEQEKLFQPYHRVEHDRQQFPGLGLGLSVAKQIILAHGGNIWVTSRDGQGSTFSFMIPVKTGSPTQLIQAKGL